MDEVCFGILGPRGFGASRRQRAKSAGRSGKLPGAGQPGFALALGKAPPGGEGRPVGIGLASCASTAGNQRAVDRMARRAVKPPPSRHHGRPGRR